MQASSVVLTALLWTIDAMNLRIFLSNIRHVKHIYASGLCCSMFSGDDVAVLIYSIALQYLVICPVLLRKKPLGCDFK